MQVILRNIRGLLALTFLMLVTLSLAQEPVSGNEWDEVDFSDTTLLQGNALTAKVVDYLYRNTCFDEQHFDSLTIAHIGFILEKAKANMGAYEFLLEYLLNGYTAMGKAQVTDYLLTYPKLKEGEITQAQGLRLDSITEPYQKVKVGAKAPDVEGMSIDGMTYGLYDSDADWVIVFFWSTDCEYCHDFLSEIRRNLNLKSDFELVTFALAEDEDEVRKTVKKMRLPGYHFYDPLRWDSKPFLDYHITSTPTVFVLNRERNIVCKPYDWWELEEWLKQHR